MEVWETDQLLFKRRAGTPAPDLLRDAEDLKGPGNLRYPASNSGAGICVELSDKGPSPIGKYEWTSADALDGAPPKKKAKKSSMNAFEPAPKSVTEFWQSLPEAIVEEIHGYKFVTLKPGTYFLGFKPLGSKVMLRPEYALLDKKLSELWEEQADAVAILGNSGIGKSCFSYTKMIDQAKAGKRVVAIKRHSLTSQPILLCNEGAFLLTPGQLTSELENPDTLYVVDGEDPSTYALPSQSKMLVVSSPTKDVIHHNFKLKGYERIYLDVWSLDQLKACRQAMFPKVTPQQFKRLFDRWGGIARYTLEKPEDDHLLEKALSKATIKALQQIEGDEYSDEANIHRLLHLRVSTDLKTTWIEFGSLFIASEVANRLWRREREHLVAWLQSSEEEGDNIGSLRGLLRELMP